MDLRATIGGARLTWSGVDRMTVHQGRIAEEVVYYDPKPLWAARDPSMRRTALIDADRLATM